MNVIKKRNSNLYYSVDDLEKLALVPHQREKKRRRIVGGACKLHYTNVHRMYFPPYISVALKCCWLTDARHERRRHFLLFYIINRMDFK